MAHIGKKVRFHTCGSFKFFIDLFHEFKSCDGIGGIVTYICGTDKIISASDLGFHHGKIKHSLVVFIWHDFNVFYLLNLRSPLLYRINVFDLIKAVRCKNVSDTVIDEDQIIVFVIYDQTVSHLICKIFHDGIAQFEIRI